MYSIEVLSKYSACQVKLDLFLVYQKVKVEKFCSAQEFVLRRRFLSQTQKKSN